MADATAPPKVLLDIAPSLFLTGGNRLVDSGELFALFQALAGVNAGLVSTGTNAATALRLQGVANNIVAAAPTGSGVMLAPALAGATTRVVNNGSGPLLVYPSRNGTIIPQGSSTPSSSPISLPSLSQVQLISVATGIWQVASVGASGGGGATAAPGIGGPPTISGAGVVGQTLSATTGAWTNIPTGYSYQWRRNGVDIPGATSSTYALVAADGNQAITCQVTATNGIGSGVQVTNTINVLPTFVFPTGMLAIYSTRLVVNGYAGPAVRLRRPSDNTILDVGFVGSNFDYAAANAFIANTVGYVEIWYDQSGNARNASQLSATITDRPQLLVVNQQGYVTFEGQLLNTASAVPANGDQTIGLVGWSGAALDQQIPVSDFDGTNGWFLVHNHGTPKRIGYFSVGSGFIDATSGNTMASSPFRMSVTRTAGSVQLRINGASAGTPVTGASNAAPSVGLGIGGYNVTSPSYEGMLSEVYVYGSALSATVLGQIDLEESVYWRDLGFLTPYAAGNGIIQNGVNDSVTFGNVLQYDQGQPWTVWGAAQLFGQSNNAQVLFTNAGPTDPTVACYEFWTDASGLLRVRLIHSYPAAQYLGVIGTPLGGTMIDGRKHLWAATYDGTTPATLASIKIYVDGAPVTTTLELNGLASLSIVTALQNFTVGQQLPGSTNIRGPFSFFQLDKVARSAAYIANYFPGSATPMPPNDAVNTTLRLRFPEGSGTTTHDESASNLTGTLSSSALWVP